MHTSGMHYNRTSSVNDCQAEDQGEFTRNSRGPASANSGILEFRILPRLTYDSGMRQGSASIPNREVRARRRYGLGVQALDLSMYQSRWGGTS